MDMVTKSDMRNAMQYLRDDLHQTVLGRQDFAMLLAKMTAELISQMREQQAATRQIGSQISQLSQRLPGIEQDINICKRDLEHFAHR